VSLLLCGAPARSRAFGTGVLVLTLSGQFLSAIGSKGTKPGCFNRPYGVAVTDAGMFVTESGATTVEGAGGVQPLFSTLLSSK
jgi:hypothetical protein